MAHLRPRPGLVLRQFLETLPGGVAATKAAVDRGGDRAALEQHVSDRAAHPAGNSPS